MHLGISSYTYGWAVANFPETGPAFLDEIGLVDQTLAFGLRCLQLGDNLPLHTLSEERLLLLKTRVTDARIRLELGARGLTEAHLARYLDLATRFGAPILRFVSDAPGYEPSPDALVGILKNALPELRRRNVTLGLENHDRFKARELAALLDRVGDDRVGICLDCVNSMGAGEGLEWVAGVLAPYTVNLHVKDFQAERLPHLMGFVIAGVPAGRGQTNLPWLLDTLAPHGRCQSAILEQWVVPEDKIIATVTKEKAWAEESMAYLKPFFLDSFGRA